MKEEEKRELDKLGKLVEEILDGSTDNKGDEFITISDEKDMVKLTDNITKLLTERSKNKTISAEVIVAYERDLYHDKLSNNISLIVGILQEIFLKRGWIIAVHKDSESDENVVISISFEPFGIDPIEGFEPSLGGNPNMN